MFLPRSMFPRPPFNTTTHVIAIYNIMSGHTVARVQYWQKLNMYRCMVDVAEKELPKCCVECIDCETATGENVECDKVNR